MTSQNLNLKNNDQQVSTESKTPFSFTVGEKRQSWDEFFCLQAEAYATRATCIRLKVGCIITKNNLQLAEGYNGSISGHTHCTEDGCLKNEQGRCIRCIHAEQNAILNAAKKGVSLEGATAYVTHEPCETCTKLLNQSGIKRIVYILPYENKYNQLFSKGMVVERLNGDIKSLTV